MRKLKFTIEDKEIAELFGRQNFTTKESAIFELVKNSYDANASYCYITFEANSIIIEDDGIGMSDHDIIEKWMRIGKSTKGYMIHPISKERKQRIYAGSMGIGRFALARLGNQIVLESFSHETKKTIQWETNWEESILKDQVNDNSDSSYTLIEIKETREKWTEKQIINLKDFIRRTCFDIDMEIIFYYKVKDEEKELIVETDLFQNLHPDLNYVQKIHLKFDSKTTVLTIQIDSSEFQEGARKLCHEDIYSSEKNINLIDEYQKNDSDENISQLLAELGDFSSIFYFGMDKVTEASMEDFLYKNKILPQRIKEGIILYRNAFSISSYDGEKDWLGLAGRARKSPAAATHETGSWRVRPNQISGHVNIDKSQNKFLVDLTNRQGLEENDHYRLFIDIIHKGLTQFERYRQKIIKDIVSYTSKEKIVVTTVLDEILKDTQTVHKLSYSDREQLVIDIINLKKDFINKIKKKDEANDSIKYDIRILNVLATQGLKSSVMAHDFHTDRNNLKGGVKYIIKALKNYGFWDKLNLKENTKYSTRNVPFMLSTIENINQKLSKFIDVILSENKKKNFINNISSVEDDIKRIVSVWKEEYKWLNFNIVSSGDEFDNYNISSDILNVIFDNLILNSYTINKSKSSLDIKIVILFDFPNINFEYSDNGSGLHKKYLDDPLRILEVHETSRDDGHGLGMWILNNTLKMHNGKVTKIFSQEGFNILFNLRGIK